MKNILKLPFITLTMAALPSCENAEDLNVTSSGGKTSDYQLLYNSYYSQIATALTEGQIYICEDILGISYDSEMTVLQFIASLDSVQVSVLTESLTASNGSSANTFATFTVEEEAEIYEIAEEYFALKLEDSSANILDLTGDSLSLEVIYTLIKISAYYDYVIEGIEEIYDSVDSRSAGFSVYTCAGLFALSVGGILVEAAFTSELTFFDVGASIVQFLGAYSDFGECLKAEEMYRRTHP